MIDISVTAEWWNLLISALLWGSASFFIMRGALLGSRSHARPRVFLGFTTTLFTIWYLLDVLGIITSDTRNLLLRGSGWTMAIALSFTAITGVRYGRKVNNIARAVECLAHDEVVRSDEDDEGDGA